MKVDKNKLKKNIENIIAEGVFNGEEIDITTAKIMEEIDEIIKAVEAI